MKRLPCFLALVGLCACFDTLDLSMGGPDGSRPTFIDFEEYPDGVTLVTQLRGLWFWGEDTSGSCSANDAPMEWRVYEMSEYLPAGSPPEMAAANYCSVGDYWVETLNHPERVEFDVIYGFGLSHDLRAWDRTGQAIPASSITRTPGSFLSVNGYTFRRDHIQIEAADGVAKFGWPTERYSVFLDNLLLVY